MIETVDPRTGTRVAGFEAHGTLETDAILDGAVRAQRGWRRSDHDERSRLLREAAAVLRRDARELSELITLEMGKPIVEAEAEIEKCAKTLDFYAERARSFLADTTVASDAADSRILYEPLGTVLAIMPWNYPFWQFFRFVAPALAAGNAAVLKHANNVPQCALKVEAIMREAGFPSGLVRTLLIESDRVAAIIADERIAAVTLTGSTEVGAIVASQAGAVLKKQVLELGGSDPFIVLADADVQGAASAAVRARFTNTGQSCVNAKRFIVEEAVADEFVEAFTVAVRALPVGDPFERGTMIGPMARENLRAQLDGQVRRTIAAGGILRTGGHVIDGPGFFYEPTVIDHVLPEHAAFSEETFGPVAAITRVADAEEAVRLANQTEYGLGAALWTNDLGRADSLARQIDAGAVFVNSVVASDPRLPFGGIKRSGYGRELGEAGIREFVNVKTLSIGQAREPGTGEAAE